MSVILIAYDAAVKRSIAGLSILFLALSWTAQAQATRPKFEVASVKQVLVKPTREGVPRGIRVAADTFTAYNITLRSLVERAYAIKDYQLSTSFSWMTSDGDLFEISAKSAQPATQDQMMLMLQSLLADRFGLRVHRETRELPIYSLVFAKGGPKMTEVAAVPSPQAMFGMFRQGSEMWNRVTGTGAPMWQITDVLTSLLLNDGRPVMDETGLKGNYSFKLDWGPEGTSGPSLFTALQDQLGLKVQPSKAPIDVVVVDSAERAPVGN